MFRLAGFLLEHSKLKLQQFPVGQSPSFISLPLVISPTLSIQPSCTWWFLGFFLNQRLTFRDHVKHYANKVIVANFSCFDLRHTCHMTDSHNHNPTCLTSTPNLDQLPQQSVDCLTSHMLLPLFSCPASCDGLLLLMVAVTRYCLNVYIYSSKFCI